MHIYLVMIIFAACVSQTAVDTDKEYNYIETKPPHEYTMKGR